MVLVWLEPRSACWTAAHGGFDAQTTRQSAVQQRVVGHKGSAREPQTDTRPNAALPFAGVVRSTAAACWAGGCLVAARVPYFSKDYHCAL